MLSYNFVHQLHSKGLNWKRYAVFLRRYVREVPFLNKRSMEGVPFLSKWSTTGKGLDLGVEPLRIPLGIAHIIDCSQSPIFP